MPCPAPRQCHRPCRCSDDSARTPRAPPSGIVSKLARRERPLAAEISGPQTVPAACPRPCRPHPFLPRRASRAYGNAKCSGPSSGKAENQSSEFRDVARRKLIRKPSALIVPENVPCGAFFTKILRRTGRNLYEHHRLGSHNSRRGLLPQDLARAEFAPVAEGRHRRAGCLAARCRAPQYLGTNSARRLLEIRRAPAHRGWKAWLLCPQGEQFLFASGKRPSHHGRLAQRSGAATKRASGPGKRGSPRFENPARQQASSRALRRRLSRCIPRRTNPPAPPLAALTNSHCPPRTASSTVLRAVLSSSRANPPPLETIESRQCPARLLRGTRAHFPT